MRVTCMRAPCVCMHARAEVRSSECLPCFLLVSRVCLSLPRFMYWIPYLGGDSAARYFGSLAITLLAVQVVISYTYVVVALIRDVRKRQRRFCSEPRRAFGLFPACAGAGLRTSIERARPAPPGNSVDKLVRDHERKGAISAVRSSGPLETQGRKHLTKEASFSSQYHPSGPRSFS